ncbi:helix-turn-helix transcriptional regulator [Metabacillus sp. KIGAM252]|uniref:Helix-turn-helix transcriptional regulator n=1 Tax=Metabacillus flavus TaxID=2823519 RepID=A0ABS5LD53_9BACI|nr:metalloregulator ArsR/SmtB family transcription factor [Metabacillus flavus]MBS2968463.1 helix-turn-helix transcriptional regulator [Metabacillus flavus]
MDLLTIFKALSNDTRLNILEWLREPEKHFQNKQAHLPKEVYKQGGVCVGDIQEKANLSQSTVSNYLSMLQKAGLLQSVRHGQWTYYRRNEELIQELSKYISKDL